MRAWAYLAAGGVLGLLIVANRRADLASLWEPAEVVPIDGSNSEQGQDTGAVDSFLSTFDPASYITTMSDADTTTANRAAFLRTIRKAEGTLGANGYTTMFGYRQFSSFADHPRQPAQFTDKQGRRLWTSAAGAYQFMAVSPLPNSNGRTTTVDTWDRIKAKLQLTDFSPASQDAAALELIREKGALSDVDAGNFEAAILKVRSVWASLPGAGYDQPERTMAELRDFFVSAGGVLA